MWHRHHSGVVHGLGGKPNMVRGVREVVEGYADLGAPSRVEVPLARCGLYEKIDLSAMVEWCNRT